MARRRTIDFEILNAHEVSQFFVELGRVPQKSVKKAARAGATLIKRKVSASAQLPVKYGFLRRSIKLVEEKHTKGSRNRSGKAGFQVTFDNRYNSIFQKKIKDVGKFGGLKDTAYYPASMEYGFKHAGGRLGGHYFMKKSAVSEESNAQDKMMEVLSKDIDAIRTSRG